MKKVGLVSVVAGMVWVGLAAGVAVGQGPGKADSSAAAPLRNGKQELKRAMTFADLMAMKRVSDPQVSPSGKWVLFSVTDVDLAKNTKVNHLWVVPLDGSLPERQVTSNTGESFGRFSPDGQFVSYTGAPTKDDPVSRITIATWDETTGTIGMGRTLQAVSGDADGAIWSPDSRHLMFTTEVYPECSVKSGAGGGGTKTTTEILSASAQNDELSNVVVGGTRNVAAWKTAAPATWAEEDACDKAKDEAAAKSPVKAQIFEGLLYRHWDHWTGEKRTHIIEADFSLAGANPRDLTPTNEVGDAETPTWELGGPQGYAWAPDSKEIAYSTNLDAVPAASTNNDIFTLRLDEPGAKAVKVSTSPGSDDGPAYSPDGKWLAWRSQKQAGFESDRFRLAVMNRSNGEINPDFLPRYTNQQRQTVGGNWVDEFAWAPDSAGIAYVTGDRGEEDVHFIPVDLNKNPLSSWSLKGGEFSDIRLSKDGTLIASMMKVNQPTEIVSAKSTLTSEKGYDIAITNTALVTLTRVNAVLLSRIEMNALESFWFAGAEGTKVEGFLLKPPGFDPAKKYPVKFLMHGGPQTAWGDAWSYRWNWELMAASGYVVIGVNRRGSTGYGQKFVDEVSGDWGGRAYEDLMKGLDYAEAKYPFIDKTRECALGASYGGFMADWVLTHTNRFQCIVTHDGMVDPVSAYGTTEELWFNEWEFRRPEDFPKGWDGFSAGYDPMGRVSSTDPTHRDKAAMNGAPAEPWRYAGLPADEDPFRRWSPMRFIADAKTPTLVIHSQKDMRLDVSQGFELFTALQRLGVPSKMLYFPDEGHWVQKPQNAELWNAVVSDWCDRWTHTGKYAEKP